MASEAVLPLTATDYLSRTEFELQPNVVGAQILYALDLETGTRSRTSYDSVSHAFMAAAITPDAPLLSHRGFEKRFNRVAQAAKSIGPLATGVMVSLDLGSSERAQPPLHEPTATADSQSAPTLSLFDRVPSDTVPERRVSRRRQGAVITAILASVLGAGVIGGLASHAGRVSRNSVTTASRVVGNLKANTRELRASSKAAAKLDLVSAASTKLATDRHHGQATAKMHNQSDRLATHAPTTTERLTVYPGSGIISLVLQQAAINHEPLSNSAATTIADTIDNRFGTAVLSTPTYKQAGGIRVRRSGPTSWGSGVGLSVNHQIHELQHHPKKSHRHVAKVN